MGAEISGGLALVHLFLEPLLNCRAAERLVSGQGALKAEKVAAETLYIARVRVLCLKALLGNGTQVPDSARWT